ncbi:AAA family ATPase [Paeniglutamicibacter gangotriensis]|uniref:Recombinational DNA repair ATPase (RecF pathway) n=1 Tax=Paeniglutamicibacter gangotriensis Lz1y TaxID=1276920 RepID=M7N9B7_9MICC|nr:AAA family ATPase [Paeniglutamicibacter gangotriensis]EMQ98379.1 Recombinational DNA repair ATPase (RecF pathway) [Paeniglutamicibacter gangotriensis Lz1y]
MAKSTEVTLKDFQRLEYVQIAPRGALVAISGRNAQGKSSILDGLEATIIGHNKRDVPRPVREGQKTAEVVNILDNGMTLTRKYKADGSSSLTGKASDGSKVAQATLNGMLGSLGMDAGAFSLLDDKKQLAVVLDLADLPFDPAKLATDQKAIFEQRTFINRKAKELEAQVARYGDLPPAPTAEVSVVELAEEIRAAEQVERKQEDDHAMLVRSNSELDRLNSEIQRLTAQRAIVESDLDSVRQIIEGHEPLPDIDALRERMATAEETNRTVRTAKEKANLVFQLEATQDQAEGLTKQLEALDKQKADGLAAAAFPVEGMSFDEEGVLLNGRPFRKASTREQTIASAHMIIASNPELRVMIVRNGNDLDSDGLAELEALGDAHDFQIFAEFVDESGEFGWTIEDGKVA